jgi:Ni,Fe-hydrogenase III large subunit/NADH:ubiquinone oxidoreductase subunit C
MSQINSGSETDFLHALQAQGCSVTPTKHSALKIWQIDSEHWRTFADCAMQHHYRWAAGWVQQIDLSGFKNLTGLEVNACFEKGGVYVILRTSVNLNHPILPSQATVYPAANRSERHSQDMFGIEFTDHPDPRRWTRHQAWDKHQFPLRKDFPAAGTPQAITPPDMHYDFIKGHGEGVYEIPVGPVHAGIIEPGHFRFLAVGELILNLEERLGYVHKGIEKIAEVRNPEQLARLAGRVSGDTTVGHTWAACMAMEQAAGITPPPRASLIRGILAEREHIANHLGDMGAICNDVAFSFAFMQFSRLRELWLRQNAKLFGHRLLMDKIIPGGVSCDLSDTDCVAIQKEINSLRADLAEIVTAVDLNTSLEDRLYTAGYLSAETAAAFGTLGFVGRASGQNFDVRRDVSYAPYHNLTFNVPTETQGDIASRFWVRAKEINVSLKLIEQMLEQLKEIGVQSLLCTSLPEIAEGSEGLGSVEGWRGEIIAYVRFAANNQVRRYYPRDPSQHNWLALEKIVLNNIVPDFPVCNKSVNASYSGCDL